MRVRRTAVKLEKIEIRQINTQFYMFHEFFNMFMF